MLSGIWSKNYCCCAEPHVLYLMRTLRVFTLLTTFSISSRSHWDVSLTISTSFGEKIATFIHSCLWLRRKNALQHDVPSAHLLHDVHLFRAQITVYWGDALHAVFSNDSSCKRVCNDSWRRLRKWQWEKTHLCVRCLVLMCNATISSGYLPPCLQHFWGQNHHTLAWPMCLLCHARLWLPLYESYQGDCDCPPPGSAYPLSDGHLVLQHHWSSPKQHR